VLRDSAGSFKDASARRLPVTPYALVAEAEACRDQARSQDQLIGGAAIIIIYSNFA
jgi:hypothetical protein